MLKYIAAIALVALTLTGCKINGREIISQAQAMNLSNEAPSVNVSSVSIGPADVYIKELQTNDKVTEIWHVYSESMPKIVTTFKNQGIDISDVYYVVFNDGSVLLFAVGSDGKVIDRSVVVASPEQWPQYLQMLPELSTAVSVPVGDPA